MKINLEYNDKKYRIEPEAGIDISIPVQFNSDRNPKFYDTTQPKNEYYKLNETEYSLEKGAGCSVPNITMNVHCCGTHTETAAHVFKDSHLINAINNLNFIPSQLITVTPKKESIESYHAKIEKEDQLITKKMLEDAIDIYSKCLSGIIIRTEPNNKNKLYRNYNDTNHAFFTNDAILFIKKLGISHLVVDTPSIDKFDDGGKLNNHKIFFIDKNNISNKNTITELAYIPKNCIDGEYLLSIGIPNFNLDAAPSRPIIYKIR